MLVGMSTVFIFLTILVFGMTIMSMIALRLTPQTSDDVSDEEVAAITAAITQHRNKTAK